MIPCHTWDVSLIFVTMPEGVVALPDWLQANAGSGFLMYASRSARATDMKAVKPTKTGSVTSAIRGTRDLRCCALEDRNSCN